MSEYKSEIRDGMRVDWDVPIEMDDGVVLRCDVYRPIEDGQYPVIMSYGPYCKWLHLQDGYPHQWNLMVNDYPETVMGTTNKYQNWELVDPEKWVPDGLRLRARGLTRRGPLAGLSGSVVAARDARFLRLHRVGGRPALEQREGGSERHLLLRDESVAGGLAPAAAPGRPVRLGGSGRFLPRPGPTTGASPAGFPRPGTAKPSSPASTARATAASRAASTATGFQDPRT